MQSPKGTFRSQSRECLKHRTHEGFWDCEINGEGVIGESFEGYNMSYLSRLCVSEWEKKMSEWNRDETQSALRTNAVLDESLDPCTFRKCRQRAGRALVQHNRKDECTVIFYHGTQSEMCHKKDSRDEIAYNEGKWIHSCDHLCKLRIKYVPVPIALWAALRHVAWLHFGWPRFESRLG